MEQPTVVPLLSESAGYRDWEARVDEGTYTVVDENGEWVLLHLQGNEWVGVGDDRRVTAFLRQHGLVLGN